MKTEKMNRFGREENRLKSVLPSLSVRTALLGLRFYKTYLSFLFAGNCRFDPTCSRYAYQAIERFGVLRGVWLGLKRLLRCHPLSRKFGYDPVPESWKNTSLYREAVECKVFGASAEQDGLYESPVTSLPRASRGHQSLHAIRSRNLEIQDEVHS